MFIAKTDLIKMSNFDFEKWENTINKFKLDLNLKLISLKGKDDYELIYIFKEIETNIKICITLNTYFTNASVELKTTADLENFNNYYTSFMTISKSIFNR